MHLFVTIQTNLSKYRFLSFFPSYYSFFYFLLSPKSISRSLLDYESTIVFFNIPLSFCTLLNFSEYIYVTKSITETILVAHSYLCLEYQNTWCSYKDDINRKIPSWSEIIRSYTVQHTNSTGKRKIYFSFILHFYCFFLFYSTFVF